MLLWKDTYSPETVPGRLERRHEFQRALAPLAASPRRLRRPGVRQRSADAHTRIGGLRGARVRPARAHVLGTLPARDAIAPSRARARSHRLPDTPPRRVLSGREPRRRAHAVGAPACNARTRIWVPFDTVLRLGPRCALRSRARRPLLRCRCRGFEPRRRRGGRRELVYAVQGVAGIAERAMWVGGRGRGVADPKHEELGDCW
jgi:hypothetical protein